MYALLLTLVACDPASTDTSDDTAKVDDTAADTGETADTSETGDTSPEDTAPDDTAPDDTAEDTDTGGDIDTDEDTDTGPPDEPDTGEDTGEDTDVSDTSTDTGEDTGADTGEDTSVDTGDTGVGSCTTGTADDLYWGVEIQDSTGVAGTSFPSSSIIFVVPYVSNPCEIDLTFDIECPDEFVSSVGVSDSTGMGIGMGVGCMSPLVTWTVPAGERIESPYDWGKLPPESYRADVDFLIGTSASTAFTVY